ncbi:hypothetical protein E9993_17055 [Labilibacter sediminis]|nr:hypothetical protein E9993_17055 [Labilibacter sediminis]
MSFSKEKQEYHLTPDGWVQGSFYGDALGGKNEVAVPKNRVITIVCIDDKTSPYSETDYYDLISWESKDKQLIKELQKQWGKRPDWFGYKRI